MATAADQDAETLAKLVVGVLHVAVEEHWLRKLAVYLGASEQALRLIISIFLGYPFALFYRQFLFYKDCYLIHLFHIVTGLSIAYFNFGNQLYHSLICVVLQFLILRLMGRTVTAVLTTFFFQMVYLLAGYFYTATDTYDIKWTMPHCVLTLKLIGLAVDYYDGGKDWNSLSIEQQKYAILRVPSLMEIAGFSYFYGGFLVGPQFSMNNYMKLVQGQMTDIPGKKSNSILPALKRLSLGLFYLVGYTLLSPYITDEYLLSQDYENRPFWFRCLYMLVWGKFVLYKYVTCWLVTEGVCILTGLGFNGLDEKGHPLWNACANMKIWLFETNPRFTGTIASFNINTNAWVAHYVFKRLKFLGNKVVSQGLSLLFLALWHGLHSGYLICFQMEFLIVIVERQAASLITESPVLSKLASITVLKPVFYLVQQTIHWLFMGYSMTAFCLFTWDKWLKVYKSIYFLGHVFFLSLLFILPYVHKIMVPRKEKLKKAE
ncbi:lysophospholipid acyltransferase 5 [Phascolarctos cinereus]|uniref:Lysophospholipid acyltransferase 5 n=1 Tax=Phascolarctos cinereus TaxID=38626 RepID=A0A6P5KVA0_PHACI|nr:lysophospholipid acyltransferase 5 [Phascolarctos cinereus]